MNRTVQTTADGSSTVVVPALKATYHSMYGALQESRHIFVQSGLEYYLHRYPLARELSVFEMGFGTGLNALLTCLTSVGGKVPVFYEAIERFPLSQGEIAQLNYADHIAGSSAFFTAIHSAAWGARATLHDSFVLQKVSADIIEYTPTEKYHIIYFDAFAPNVQPELWTVQMFARLADILLHPGILVTYCSKGDVQRAMKAAGFHLEKLPGPKGKREIIRASMI
jgi:tRNA U34 5-methylaminomethyl-2-thiouridine-forming methyltransferase MnmC